MPPPRDLDFWPFDLEVGVGVACDLGYPCAKFRLPRPFGFRVRADVRDIRQTDGRQTPITALCPLGGGIINCNNRIVYHLYAKLCFSSFLRRSLFTHWMQVKLLLSLLIWISDAGNFCQQTVQTNVKFWDGSVCKTKSELIFGFPHSFKYNGSWVFIS